MTADYQCTCCSKVTNFQKPYQESFPSEIQCECGNISVRLWTPPIAISIAEGMDRTGTYHASKFTPTRNIPNIESHDNSMFTAGR